MKRLILIATSSMCLSATACSGAESSESQVWQNFKTQTGEYILPDFSYAGYKCGEVAVPALETLGYTTFDVTTYGAVANDGKSDRAAFEATIAAVAKNGGGIIYFPEGVFDIHAEGDPDETIAINTSNTVIKGAGRDKSTILISAPNHPKDPNKLWTSPTTIVFSARGAERKITDITGDSPRGSFTIEVASSEGLKAGDWINITLPSNNDPELVRQELCSCYEKLKDSSLIKQKGVHVDDFHEIKSINGNTITLVEPIIYPIESRWGWIVQAYPHLKGVGVEDIAFEGDCVPDFEHHRSWNDDGGYKPLAISRSVDSWIRRVDFRSVSEAATIALSARVSAYDVNISGKRGHSAIRSQNSSRVFIGKIFDFSNSQTMECAGQWHAVGSSNHSLGAVLWRNEWGFDSNFESHASQPRATLFDACKGGFLRLHQGGGEAQLPNHLGDLVIWNHEATATEPERTWQWWDSETIWTRFLPPVIVGFHGKELIFEPSQTLIEESHGTPIEPESLYEAQLKLRLGELPSWLEELK